jgi:methionyl-tRNA formyltransferase
MSVLRVVFFGTPEFAVPSLEALSAAGFDVPLVVTQPDRPVGRHAEPRPSAVARAAVAHGTPVARPASVRDAAFLSELEAARPDAVAVVAFGRILPPPILGLPRLGCVNVHASLLPRFRGASPIQAAILAGDRETGVATMRMEEGLDTGPVYLERRVSIGETETAGELARRLSSLGGALLVETLRGLEAGVLVARPQEGEIVTCRPIRREDGRVDWSRSAVEIERALRAYTPWPGLHTFLGGERVKVLEAGIAETPSDAPPGAFRLENGALLAAAGGGSTLRLDRLQREGRRPVTGAEFARAAHPPGRFESPR